MKTIVVISTKSAENPEGLTTINARDFDETRHTFIDPADAAIVEAEKPKAPVPVGILSDAKVQAQLDYLLAENAGLKSDYAAACARLAKLDALIVSADDITDGTVKADLRAMIDAAVA